MSDIVIISPFEVWSKGMESILSELGSTILGRWPKIDGVCQSSELARAHVLVLAWCLLSQSESDAQSQMISPVFRGRTVLVLEPGDDFSADDFVAFDVDGVLMSNASIRSVIECMDSIGRGGRWVDPGIRTLLMHMEDSASSCEELSSREVEVASLAASGLSNKEIARRLNVSDGTIKMHIHHILTKMRLRSRVELTIAFKEKKHEPHQGDWFLNLKT